MLKDEFQQEEQLKKQLDKYEVQIPELSYQMKRSRWERFIQYLASPTKDPLEPICTSSVGFTSLRVVPIVCGIFVTIFQILMQL